MIKYIVLLALLTAIGIAVAWQRVEAIRMGYTLQEMRSLRDELREQRRQLQYQVSSLSSPARLMDVVRENEQNLVEPPPGTAVARGSIAPAPVGRTETAPRAAPANWNVSMRQ